MATPGSVRYAVRSGPAGSLGRIRYSGRVDGGRGVPTGPLRRYDGYALMFLYAGAGRYRDAAHDIPLAPGALVDVVPGHPHWYGVTDPSSTWREVHVVMEGPVFDLAQTQGLLDTTRPVRRLSPVDYWLERIDHFRVHRPPVTSAGADDEVCALLRLLVEISARAETGTEGARIEPAGSVERRGWLAASQARLAADLGEPLDLAHVAASVGVPYETWRKRFQAETGVAPARWRLLRRVEAVGELLRRTSLPVRDIAADLGFSDGHHLSKTLRASTGMTTREFRRTMG